MSAGPVPGELPGPCQQPPGFTALRPEPAAGPASVASPGAAGHVTPIVPAAPVVNIANALTLLRLALVPLFVAFMLVGDGHRTGWRVAACVVFAVAACTDRVDGQIARRLGLVTSFGKLADPIADKALIGAALVTLAQLGDLPWAVTAVILGREVGVTLLRLWVLRHGVLPASRGGKLKTLSQTVAIGLYVLPLTGPMATCRAVLLGIAVVLTVVTGVDYVFRALALRRA